MVRIQYNAPDLFFPARFCGPFLYPRHARRISTTEPFGGELTEWSV
ncbi:hypothetical protein HMPREF1623_04631 [Escherichia coli 910096-2]|nr:hypothetical protein HMPREF1623_04631 [Escherichia coli 910096-2]